MMIVTVCSWFSINGVVFFHFEHLADRVGQYHGQPPQELLDQLTDDGAIRVFSLFFGYIYGYIYLTPWLGIYGIANCIRADLQKRRGKYYFK